MSLPQSTQRPREDQFQSPHFVPLEGKESLGTGPANEMIARLAAALAHDEEYGETVAVDEKKWPLAKTLAVLFGTCTAFWLLLFALIVAFS